MLIHTHHHTFSALQRYQFLVLNLLLCHRNFLLQHLRIGLDWHLGEVHNRNHRTRQHRLYSINTGEMAEVRRREQTQKAACFPINRLSFLFCRGLKATGFIRMEQVASITCSDAFFLGEEVEISLDMIYISPRSQRVPRVRHNFRVAS